MLPLLLRAPSFLTAVGALFWCFQGAALTGFLRWWRLRGPRSDVKAAYADRAAERPGLGGASRRRRRRRSPSPPLTCSLRPSLPRGLRAGSTS